MADPATRTATTRAGSRPHWQGDGGPMSAPSLRWDQYHIEKGARVQEFWQTRRVGGRTLHVMGLGFDPRTPLILEILVGAGTGPIDVRLLHFDEGPDSVSQRYATEVSAN